MFWIRSGSFTLHVIAHLGAQFQAQFTQVKSWATVVSILGGKQGCQLMWHRSFRFYIAQEEVNGLEIWQNSEFGSIFPEAVCNFKHQHRNTYPIWRDVWNNLLLSKTSPRPGAYRALPYPTLSTWKLMVSHSYPKMRFLCSTLSRHSVLSMCYHWALLSVVISSPPDWELCEGDVHMHFAPLPRPALSKPLIATEWGSKGWLPGSSFSRFPAVL